ncbi:hypothetical protein JL720_130 [Aureococcus anophagefferens]|nr:hypothetical protein JL720_130 [Aureococcus anophagefferens]
MGSPIALASLALMLGSPGVAALASLAGAASPNGTLLWRSAVGCHRWGPGCWVPNFSGTDASPAVSPRGATVVVGSYDGTVYALDGADGSVRWNASLDMGVGEGTPGSPRLLRRLRAVRRAVPRRRQRRGDLDLRARRPDRRLRRATAARLRRHAAEGAGRDRRRGRGGLWRYEGQGEVWATHGPRVVGDLVCAGFGGAAYVKANCSATVDCVNRSTGALAWRAPAGLQVQSTPAVGASQLYVGSYDDCLASLARRRFAVADGGVGSSAALRGDTLYVGGPDAFFALDADSGAERWRHTTGAMVGSSPAVFGTRVYVGCEDGYLYAFDVEDDP